MLLLFDGELAARDTLRFAEEKAGFGLWQIQFASGELNCSPNGLRLLGLPLENGRSGEPLTFASIETVAHLEDRPVLAELRHIMAQSLPFDRQFRVVHRNGRVRTLAIHGEVLIGADGKRSRAVGVLTDITHHSEAMLSAHIVTERLRVLMGGIGGAMWIAESDGRIIDFLMRDSFETRPPSELLGHKWLSFIFPTDREKLIAGWEKAAKTNDVFIQDYRVRDADGTYQWRRCYAAPLCNEDGSVREWIGLSLYVDQNSIFSHETSTLITGAQIRAGRAILNWSVRDLADKTGLTSGVVRRMEEADVFNEKDKKAVSLVNDALSAGGVEFIVLPDGRACVSPARTETQMAKPAESRLRLVSTRQEK